MSNSFYNTAFFVNSILQYGKIQIQHQYLALVKIGLKKLLRCLYCIDLKRSSLLRAIELFLKYFQKIVLKNLEFSNGGGIFGVIK